MVNLSLKRKGSVFTGVLKGGRYVQSASKNNRLFMFILSKELLDTFGMLVRDTPNRPFPIQALKTT